jgi:hypothetical protein
MFPLCVFIIAGILTIANNNNMKSFQQFLIEGSQKIQCDLDGICREVIQDESAGNEEKIKKVYKDSKGFPTIAHGHLIGPNSKNVLGKVIKDSNRVNKILAGQDAVTSDEAMGILKIDVEERLPKLKKLIPSFESQSPELQAKLYSEYHRGMLQQSPVSVQKFNKGDYEGFATNYVKAKDYTESKKAGTGIYKRMDRLVTAVRTEPERQKKRQQSSLQTNQAPQSPSTSQTPPSR